MLPAPDDKPPIKHPREKMLHTYAPVKAAAKERQREHGGTAPGRPKETLVVQIAQVSTDARKTRTLRAKAAGTPITVSYTTVPPCRRGL